MAVNGQLIDAIVHEYLLKKDKSLAQVFQHKTKAVCTYLTKTKITKNVVREVVVTQPHARNIAIKCVCVLGQFFHRLTNE